MPLPAACVNAPLGDSFHLKQSDAMRLSADARAFPIDCVLGATVVNRVMRRVTPQFGVGERHAP